MDAFKLEGRIEKQTIEEITTEYQSLLTSYRRKIINQIIDTVQDEIRGIPEHKMEEWIDDYLISDIKSNCNRHINKLHMTINTILENLITNINNHQNIENSFKQYLEELKEIVKKEKLNGLEDISHDFKRHFIRKIENYYDAFYGISDRNFTRALGNIEENLKIILRKANQQFLEEYQEVVKKGIIKNAKKIKENIDAKEKEDKKITEEEIEKISTILKYNNYELHTENNKLYVYNKETKEKQELLYNKKNNLFYTSNKNIGIIINKQYTLIVDTNTNTTMLKNDVSLEISTIDRKNIIKISQGFEGYEIFINNKEILTKKEILIVIEIIKQKSPAYYEELIKSQQFVKLLENTKQNDKEPSTDRIAAQVEGNNITKKR